jgi:CheY-like chemotaxis protein
VASDLNLSLEGLRILAVDDDPDACIVLRRILEEQNAIVDTASSVAVALEIIDTRPPDLLVSDIGMPGQDGYQFIARVRKLEGPVRAIPAIALTAFSRHEDRISALHAGFNMHVAKPVNALELLTVISALRSGLRH